MTALRLIIVLSLILGVVEIQAKPQVFEASYRAEYRGIPASGRAFRKLSELGSGKFELTTSIKALFFSYKENSTFRWEPNDEMVSLDYQSSRKVFGSKHKQHFHFDWQGGKILENDQPWDLSLESGIMDRNSYQIKLKEDLRSFLDNPAQTRNLIYRIADKGRLKTYEFELLNRETIDTPLGKLNTIKAAIKRNSDHRFTFLWLALDWDLLLVQLEQIERGRPALKLTLTEAVLGDLPVRGL